MRRITKRTPGRDLLSMVRVETWVVMGLRDYERDPIRRAGCRRVRLVAAERDVPLGLAGIRSGRAQGNILGSPCPLIPDNRPDLNGRIYRNLGCRLLHEGDQVRGIVFLDAEVVAHRTECCYRSGRVLVEAVFRKRT